jgi:hypothetical protein
VTLLVSLGTSRSGAQFAIDTFIQDKAVPFVIAGVAEVLRLDDQFLCCLFITGMAWTGNQILAKTLHLYGCFLYLLSIFVALPW